MIGSTTGQENRVGNPSGDYVVELVVSHSGQHTISTCNPGTNYDTYLRIYSDSNLSDQLDANDDSCGSHSEIERFLAAGTYYVVVEGYSRSEGNFELSITCPDAIGK